MPDQSIDTNISRLYDALANPVRRRIIQLLREKGRAGFKELHDTLKISVGALYHHLDTLEGVIVQDNEKKYLLSNRARSAIDTLTVSEEKIVSGNTRHPMRETRSAFLSKEILFGRSIFSYLNEEPLRSLPIAIMIVVLGGWLSSQTNLEPLLLFYVNASASAGFASVMLLFPLGWLATFAMAELLSILVFHRRGGELSLLNGTAFAMLPLLIVPGLSLVNFFSPTRTAGYLVVLLPILLQVWVVCLLSSAISVSKGLKLERTALASLVIMYLNILVLLATLQLGIL
jgi:DNA-binding transcriptional ArsR family regulator